MYLFFSALVVARLWNIAVAQALSPAFERVPTAENFWRRAFHASTLVGNYVVIDGGEEWLVPFGNSTIQQQIVDYTLSIDMSKSWTNASVPYQLINKTNTAPNLNNEKLWPSNDNKSCFVFGGAQSYIPNVYSPPFLALWQFTINSTGGGAWTQFQTGTGTVFGSLTRPDVPHAATVDNTGFIMGGHQDSHSSQESLDLVGENSIPGIVSYNITSGFWSNDSAPANVSNTFLAPVSNFGPSGLLVGAGHGEYSPTGPSSITEIAIYEPLGKTWHNQTTNGNAPAARDSACSVGLPGDNGTYEIFIYGGVSVIGSGLNSDGAGGNLTQQTVDANTALDEVWVLSLPAFAWFKANYTAETNRWRQSCSVVGNRQMISIGGQNLNDLNLGRQSRDPFTQGIGIFDLTELTWSSGYEAHAAPYVTPQVVKDWYSAGNKATFQDPAVEGFFKSTTSSPSANVSPSSSSSPTNPKSSSNAGAIAGGVVGGLAGLALIAGLVWLWLRRRRGKRSNQGQDYHPAPLEDNRLSGGTELEDKVRMSELHGRRDGYEAPELDDSSIRGPVEMQADNPR